MSLPQNQHPSKTDLAIESPSSEATRCCVITGVGRSAVAVVAVRGHDAIEIALRCFHGASGDQLRGGQVRYGTWSSEDEPNTASESVVVTPLADSEIEIHCHGGTAAMARIVADLQACGVTQVNQASWSRGDRSLLIREANDVLARCLTARTAAIAMDQVRGAMLHWALGHAQAMARGDASPDVIRQESEAMLRMVPLGRRLTDPYRIVLVGPPNVGKSSLLNAIVGYDRSITYDGAGTTRDVLHAETVIDGWPVRLSDTAGIRETSEPIELQGVTRARSAAVQADLLLLVTEPDSFDPIIGAMLTPIQLCDDAQIPVFRILNKEDLWIRDLRPQDCQMMNPLRGDSSRERLDLCTNAITGKGIDALMDMISRHLAQVVPEPGAPVPISQRQAQRLTEIVKSVTSQQLEDGLNSLLGFDLASEEP